MITDPLRRLADQLHREIEEARGCRHALVSPEGIAADDFYGAAYDEGLVAGLTLAADLVEREQAQLAQIDAEHVPGRVYGPGPDADTTQKRS